MSCKYADYFKIIEKAYHDCNILLTMDQLRDFLNKQRPHLKQLNRDHFADLRAQQDKASRELSNI